MAYIYPYAHRKPAILVCFIILFQFISLATHAQMRQAYNDAPGNDIKKISFYTAKEGYVAFTNWVGYTVDSGKTFVQKPVTFGNVNFNGYSVNLTFGFGMNGVKAFDQNNIILYGDYGLVPSILYSSNGGTSFTLIYHSQYSATQLSTGITDMVFPQNGTTGFAVDADRILKSTDQGHTWNVIRTDPGSFFDHLEAVDVNNIFALTTGFTVNKLLKTTNAGTSWQLVNFPALAGGKMNYATFLTASTGWLNMHDDNGDKYFYKTTNGGNTWVLQNDIIATPFECTKMTFTDVNTGYALKDLYIAYKTTNSGVTWEPLPRNNNFTYLGYSHDDLFFISNTQFWAGGGHGFLEISTNAGGTPLPKAYFKFDTVGVAATNNVNLLNYSKTGYTYKWFLNGVQISTAYNTSYTHNIYRSVDSVKLVVSNGSTTDTTLKMQYFVPALPPNYPTITSFTPASGYPGSVVAITGTNFTGTTAVSFGGTAAASFTVVSNTQINAVVGNGATGSITVTTPIGSASKTGFTFATRLKINSFTPVSGAVGTLITINGTNFSPNINDNIVYLGAVKATVITAGSNQLVVRSEPGSSYQSISVTVNGLTVFSDYYFLTTFDNGGTIDTSSFAQKVSFTSNNSTMLLRSDLDGDGKPDLISGDENAQKISILRNTSTINALSFDPKIDLTVNVESAISVGDMDGDGKPDLVANVYTGLTTGFHILKNTSSAGNIAFATPLYIPNTFNMSPDFMSIADFNSDGKPDILGVSNNVNIAVLKNTSSGSSLSFNLMPYIHMNWFWINECKAADFDGDGKPDIAVTNTSYTTQRYIYFYRNISVNDSIMFHDPYPQITAETLGSLGKIAFGDYDGDGKLDIAMLDGSNGIGKVSIFRNTSVIGSISFASRVVFDSNQGSASISTDDLNGDGKPDIAFTNFNEDSVSVLENMSTAGNISFGNHVKFKIFSTAVVYHCSTVTNDLNGDGKADIAAVNGNNQITVLLNNGGATLVELCQGNGSITSDITGSIYQWQQNSGSGFVNISNNINFSGTTTAILQLTSVPIAWNNYKYRCVVNSTLNSKTFKIMVTTPVLPAIAITAPNITICAGSSITFTAAITNGGTAAAYQWQVNGVNAGTNSATFTTTTLLNSDQVKCILTSNANCITTATATSNVIIVTVNPTVVPAVTTSTTTPVICSGTAVTFTAVPTNGGTSPVYQWKVNNINVGTNSATFTSSSLINNDQVKLVLTSNSACAVPTTATSNIITMTVNASVTASVSIAANNTTVCAGSAVNFTATAVNGGAAPIYQWQVNGINAGTNSSTFISSSLNNNDQVKCLLTSNAGCVTNPNSTSNGITVTVNAPVTPTIAINSNTTTICSGSVVTFTAAATNGGTSPAYQWQVNGVNAGTNSATFTSIALLNGDQVKCILTSNAGCVTTTSVTSNIITITVSATVTPAVSITASTTNICAGSTVSFTATATNEGSNPVYQWQVNSSNAGTNSSSFSSSSLTNNAQVKVIVTSSLSCAVPATATSNMITINVTPIPVANAGNDVSTCAGTGVQLNGSGGSNYSWSPATGLSNPNIANPIANPATTTTYTLTVSNGSCSSTDAVIVTVTALVNNPSVNITASANNICAGYPVTFTALAVNAGTAPIYQWQVNAVSVGNNNSSFTSSTINNNDQVKVMLTSNSACVTNNTATSNIITMNVQQLAIPLVSLNNKVFTVSNPDAAAVYTWQVLTNNVWGDIIPAAYGITYTASLAGEYRVKATKGLCTEYSVSAITNLAGRMASNNAFGIYLYPNPVSNVVTLDSIKLTQNWETLKIINADGKHVLPVINIKNQTSVSINVSVLKQGTYFIQLRKKDGEFTTIKFVKI